MIVELVSNESVKNQSSVPHQQQTSIDQLLKKLSRLEFPAKEHFESYMRHKWRLNHKPRTLQSSFTSVRLFLDFYGKSGKRDLTLMERADLDAFVEHEQDRGLRISTVRTRLACIIAFLHFLVEQGVISGVVLKRRMKLKFLEVLLRAMNPSDVKNLLAAIDDIRARAVILLLLGAGMRIGRPWDFG